MSRRTQTIWASAIAVGLVVSALILLPALLHGNDSHEASPRGSLVIHEWGTFTSFAGSNGVNLEFRPLVSNDLPQFVVNAFPQPFHYLSKPFVARQRMETPVTYFYTDVPRMVNVRVDFPKGMLTEWYPVVKHFESGKDKKTQLIVGDAFLDWGPLRLTPSDRFADVRVRGGKGQAVPASLPTVGANDHYGRARETDSAVVETIDANGGSHFEKFLFYRGVGDFELPIKLAALGHDRFEVTNADEHASGALFLLRIENDRVRFTRMDAISPRAAIEINLSSAESTVDSLAEAMVRELVAAGLFEKEALAMVNTWRTSWFGENGTRLLYLVLGELTDELLPLSVDPAPDERVRVLVGRLETLTPEDCQRLTHTLVGSGPGEKPSSEAIKAELASLGRFAEPAIQFVSGQATDPRTRDQLEEILADIRGDK